MEKKQNKYPINHIIGFALSITLTIIAVWTALSSDLPVMWIIIAIMALAVIQAGIQLFMFMHITERGATHAPWNMMSMPSSLLQSLWQDPFSPCHSASHMTMAAGITRM